MTTVANSIITFNTTTSMESTGEDLVAQNTIRNELFEIPYLVFIIAVGWFAFENFKKLLCLLLPNNSV